MYNQIRLIVIHLVFKIQSVFPVEWCDIHSCENPSSHIMCKYKDVLNTKDCPHIKVTSNTEFKEDILHAHNEYRNRWANNEIEGKSEFPMAGDMLLMTWDEELELLAERNVKNCLKHYDICRDTELYRVGQSIGTIHSEGKLPDSTKIFQSWIHEGDHLQPPQLAQYTGGSADHFTQALWSRTNLLGCAQITYKEAESKRNVKHLVCNYAPGGNLLGDFIYKRGNPCSACPDGTECKNINYPFLCAGQNPVRQLHKMNDVMIFLTMICSLGIKEFLTLVH